LDDSPKFKTGLSPTPYENASSDNQRLLHFLVRGLLAAGVAKLLGFHALGVFLLVLRRRVVAVFAFPALQGNDLAHRSSPFNVEKHYLEKLKATR
jgi:hypothetical protein